MILLICGIYLKKNHRKTDLTCDYPEVGGQVEEELEEGN